jgi:hypothetical protein
MLKHPSLYKLASISKEYFGVSITASNISQTPVNAPRPWFLPPSFISDNSFILNEIK